MISLNVTPADDIFSDSAYFITDSCENCKINLNCNFKTDKLLSQISKVKVILITLLENMTPTTKDEQFIKSLDSICYQNTSTLIFYLQSIMFKLMYKSLNCDDSGYAQVPIYFSQNPKGYLSFNIQNRTIEIKI